MKKSLLLILSGIIFLNADAQKKPGTYWTSAGGLKAGVNNSNIRFGSGTPTASTSDAWRYGAVGGLWISAPISSNVSFQPELTYSMMGGHASFPGVLTNYSTFSQHNLKTSYITVPLLLKVHAGKLLAFYAGPQFGLLLAAQSDILKNNSTTSGVKMKDSLGTTDISAAGGIQLFPRGKVHLDFRYIYGLNNFWTAKTGNYFNQAFQATLGLRLWGKKKVVLPPDSDGDGIYDKDDNCPTIPGVAEYQGCPIPDTDGDGINDKEDKCPTVKGVAEYQGCPIPDTDGDGINDKEDKCPTVKGVAEYQGCPIPDTDGDGLNDKEDKCPTVAGPRDNQGCPIPDTDGDGLNDREDKCPTLAGPKDNMGCPVVTDAIKKRVDFAAKNILFVTGSYKLLSRSNKGLNDVVKIMQENPDIFLAIDGHTDNVGKDEMNQTLSDNRAGSVKDYIISKGISESRITSAGHGETMPVADNKTAAGRQKNRRVEMTLSYYK